jgi:type VI secretion system protein ImpA
MATIDFTALRRAVADDNPCGPDLDLAGDADYMNFVARAEGLLPTTFFSGPEGRTFDRSSIDFDAECATVLSLANRTHDIRLLVILAKLLALGRDLAGFVGCVGLIEWLLAEHWDEVHPRAADGDFGIRVAALESLDDMPPVIFPLQYLPLVNDRRLGPLSYRNWLVAGGEAKPRAGEVAVDSAALDTALMDADFPALVETRDVFNALQTALKSIRQICVDRLGAERAAKFERLPALAADVFALLERVVAKRDPAMRTTGGLESTTSTVRDDSNSSGAAAAVSPAALASARDVADALASVAEYFSRHEPSSPALLLVRQAEQLMGKSFLEVLRALVPAHLEQATIRIGRDHLFDLPVERLSAFADPAERTDNAVDPAEDDTRSPRPEAKSRADAIRLLDQIGSYYRVAEPSSPVPLLTERARNFAERDFLSLLKELLPEGALKGIGGT